MTDNKDPQITPEMVQEWLDKQIPELTATWYHGLELLSLCRAFLQLSTELKQLRAERAGLLVWIDEHIELADEIMTQDEKDLLIEIKSKLTDSAQSIKEVE